MGREATFEWAMDWQMLHQEWRSITRLVKIRQKLFPHRVHAENPFLTLVVSPQQEATRMVEVMEGETEEVEEETTEDRKEETETEEEAAEDHKEETEIRPREMEEAVVEGQAAPLPPTPRDLEEGRGQPEPEPDIIHQPMADHTMIPGTVSYAEGPTPLIGVI
jgi:hypothetical protein